MATFILSHAHASGECSRAFAAWRGFESPLRHAGAVGSCRDGGHRIWWRVEADDAGAALALLPSYVAARTEACEVRPMLIP